MVLLKSGEQTIDCSVYPMGLFRLGKVEDKLLERFYTISQIVYYEVSSFEKGDLKSLYDAWEIFKLILRKCHNHNVDNMEHMQHFTWGLRVQIWMLLDA